MDNADTICGRMKILKMIFGAAPSLKPPAWVGKLALSTARTLALLVVSVVLTFVFAYVLFGRIAGESISFQMLLHPDAFWPLMALAAAVTLANRSVTLFLMRRRRQLTDRTTSGNSGNMVVPESESGRIKRQVLHLTRSAERLDNVERDLIRKLSDSFPVDLTTRNLLTEMRICTNRLRGQLSDLEQLNPPDQTGQTGTDSKAPAAGRHVTAGPPGV